jgi:nicotinamidase-related amidase
MPADVLITTEAKPYSYTWSPKSTALVIIDMQRDFIEPGGFGESLGNDVSILESILPATSELLAFARGMNMLVVHTRESHLPDLSDCPPSKIARGNAACKIGDVGPMGRVLVRGEPGNDIVPSLRPAEGEIVIDKPGKGAFYATGLQQMLAARGITHLLFAGVTTEVCVQSTMREANDRGYECLLVEDATASYFPAFKEATIAMIHAQGGIVGWTTSLHALTGSAVPNHGAQPATTSPFSEQVNLPEVVAKLTTLSDAYGQALLAHDLEKLGAFFWDDAQTVRYGLGENLYGIDAIRSYRQSSAPIHPQRRTVRRVITTFGRTFATVSLEYGAPDTTRVGRQMQTWVCFPQGWRIVAAQVSLL